MLHNLQRYLVLNVIEMLNYTTALTIYSVHGFNPLIPDMKMHILLTVFHKFLIELVRRICLISRHLILGDHFLYCFHLNV